MRQLIELKSGPLLALLLIFALAWFGTLDQRRLINPDEGRYSEIPREMVASGDWLTPRLNGLKYFEKPALQYWATASAFTLFGEHHWTARLWPALTGFLGILVTALATIRLFGLQAGLIAGAVLAGSVLWNVIGHVNTLDMGVSFFLAAAVFALCLAQRDNADPAESRRWQDGAWVLLALAVLSKGLIGLVLPAATVVAYALWQRDLGFILRIRPLRGLLILLAITAPWFIAVSLANPEFAHFFFIHEHFQRFLTKAHGRYQPMWYFLPILLIGMLPWLGSLLPGLVAGMRRKTGLRFQPQRFLLVWTVLVFVFFSVSSSKLASYILPIFPTLAALIGLHLSGYAASRRIEWHALPAIVIGAACLVLVPFVTRFANEKVPVALYEAYQPWLYGGAGALLLGAILAFWLGRQGRSVAAVMSLAFGGFAFGQGFLLGHDSLGSVNSAHDVAAVIRPQLKPEVPFFSVDTYDQSLQFYLKRTTTMVGYRDELGFGIAQEPEKFIPDIAGFEQAWNAAPEAWALMSPGTWKALDSKGFPMTEVVRDTRRVVVRTSPLPSPRPEGEGDDCSAARDAASVLKNGPGLGRPCAAATK
ncbi:MAG: glycosyltransferase family 39 protein [Burkholderiaceae bacterium]|nr:glycosyltransferase family 39 protein [Sulfuritalea sp.]MCF8175614.1 glycosyltransferase family 39 protein [Burkholderiaceae bacterium]